MLCSLKVHIRDRKESFFACEFSNSTLMSVNRHKNPSSEYRLNKPSYCFAQREKKNKRKSESTVCKFPKLVLPKQLFHRCFRLIDYISELSTVGPISAACNRLCCCDGCNSENHNFWQNERLWVLPRGTAEHCNCAEIHFRTWRRTGNVKFSIDQIYFYSCWRWFFVDFPSRCRTWRGWWVEFSKLKLARLRSRYRCW